MGETPVVSVGPAGGTWGWAKMRFTAQHATPRPPAFAPDVAKPDLHEQGCCQKRVGFTAAGRRTISLMGVTAAPVYRVLVTQTQGPFVF